MNQAIYEVAWRAVDLAILRGLSRVPNGIAAGLIGIECHVSSITSWAQRQDALDRLEEGGLVSRRTAPDDPAFVIYEITSAGREEVSR